MGLNEYERKHNKLLRKYGAECTVLLKKDGHFPIKTGGNIALYGSGAIIRFSKEAVTKKVRSVTSSPDFEDWSPDKDSKPKENIDLNVPVINVNSEDIETQTVVYDKEYEIDGRNFI